MKEINTFPLKITTGALSMKKLSLYSSPRWFNHLFLFLISTKKNIEVYSLWDCKLIKHYGKQYGASFKNQE